MLINLEFNIIINLLYIIFFIGIYGITGRSKSYLIMFGSLEILLLSLNLQFTFVSISFDIILGQLFSIFILLVAAAEISIGLAILLVYWRIQHVMSLDVKSLSKG